MSFQTNSGGDAYTVGPRRHKKKQLNSTVLSREIEVGSSDVLQPKSSGRLESTSTIRCGWSVYQRLQESTRQVDDMGI